MSAQSAIECESVSVGAADVDDAEVQRQGLGNARWKRRSDWIHALLTPSEQAMLRRLAVFVGGADLEAAEAVGTGGGVRAEDVLDLISSLVEKSLVQREEAEIHTRYQLHETMREYGLVQLRTANELNSMRIAHLRWYSGY